MKEFDKKIKERLRMLGKSQTDLARYLGVSNYGLSKMINRGTFKSDYMLKISKFLEVDINFFGMNMKEGSENISANEAPAEYQTKVDMLKQIITSKDEVIKAKEELIATLKDKLHKK